MRIFSIERRRNYTVPWKRSQKPFNLGTLVANFNGISQRRGSIETIPGNFEAFKKNKASRCRLTDKMSKWLVSKNNVSWRKPRTIRRIGFKITNLPYRVEQPGWLLVYVSGQWHIDIDKDDSRILCSLS